MESLQNICTLFGELLSYPIPALQHRAAEGAEVLSTNCPAAAQSVAGFHEFLGQESQARIEEIYTNTFDLQGACYPYVGHYLFGESYKRSWFMARLSQEYREKDFSPGDELPDHIGTILRFLARWDEGEFSRVLIVEGLKPAVDKMLLAFGDGNKNPYKLVLQGLSQLLNAYSSNQTPASLAEMELGGLSHA